MKRGKEIKLEVSDNYNVMYGTIDHKNPQSIYIGISGWGQPKSDGEEDYDRVIKSLHKDVKRLMTNIESDVFKVESIVDVDMRESGVRFNKRSFMDCEITLYQKNKYLLGDEKILNDVNSIITSLLELFNTSKYFNFYKTKK